MSKKTQIAVSFIIVLQIIFIVLLGKRIGNYIHPRVLSLSSVADSIYKNSDQSRLKYYYELNSNSKIKELQLPWLQNKVIYDINNAGLNDSINYSSDNPNNAYRIITIGDSFTFGIFVNTHENWTEILETELNDLSVCSSTRKFEVINLSVPGYDIEYSVERYRQKGMQYQPELILWMLKEDDFNEINEIMRKNQESYIQSMKQSGEYDRLIAEGNPYPFVSKLQMDMKDYKEDIGIDTLLAYQKERLEEIYQYYKNSLVFLVFPNLQTEMQLLLESQITHHDNTKLITLSSIYEPANLTFAPNDYHPNVLGHKQIAKEVAENLIKMDLIPCH